MQLPEDPRELIDHINQLDMTEFTKIKEAETISSETRIKQKLFSKFAHEFKTPLLVIKNLAQEFIHSEGNIEAGHSICFKISNLSDYITFLITDIIFLSVLIL